MNYIIPHKIQNKMKTFPLSAISLDNEIGRRFDKFIYNRVSSDFAINEILSEAERFFATKLDDEYGSGMWRGEFWGKLMLSAARVADMKQDKKLCEELSKSVYRLLEYQDEGGYIGTYSNKNNILDWNLDDPTSKLVGWNSNWNAWNQKYTLWALIECAMLLDDKKILHAAERLADSFINTVEELSVSVSDLGVQHGMASGSILKPLLKLYRLTGNENYFAFAKEIAKDWDRDDGKCPNIIRNSIDKIPVHKWYDRNEGWNPKAYEMMSCFDGICELYRLTGDERLLLATESFAELLIKHESNVLGSVGYGELFFNASEYADAATEICDVIHWMRLCHELFLITGSAKYIECFESAFLNAFLAGVYPDEGWGAFFIRSSGRHWTPYHQCDGKYQHCCVNNVPRGFANAAETLITESDGAYYINSYIPTTVHLGDVMFHIDTGYITNGDVSITVRGLKPGTKVYLRAPAWSESSKAILYHEGGETELSCGAYTPVTINKKQSVIRMLFDMKPRILSFEHEFKELDKTDYHVHRWIDPSNGMCDKELMLKAPMCTLRRGPLILARSKKIGSREEDMFSGETVFGKRAECTAEGMFCPGLLTLNTVTIKTDEGTKTYTMCDYASAANSNIIESAHYFTIFI